MSVRGEPCCRSFFCKIPPGLNLQGEICISLRLAFSDVFPLRGFQVLLFSGGPFPPLARTLFFFGRSVPGFFFPGFRGSLFRSSLKGVAGPFSEFTTPPPDRVAFSVPGFASFFPPYAGLYLAGVFFEMSRREFSVLFSRHPVETRSFFSSRTCLIPPVRSRFSSCLVLPFFLLRSSPGTPCSSLRVPLPFLFFFFQAVGVVHHMFTVPHGNNPLERILPMYRSYPSPSFRCRLIGAPVGVLCLGFLPGHVFVPLSLT